MADFRYVDYIANIKTDIDFIDFITLVKGSSITTLASADDYIEFGLSDGFNLRIDHGGDVSLISTLNKGEIAPIRLNLISNDEPITALLFEVRLHAIRQIYAMNLLFNEGREVDLIDNFSLSMPKDIEFLLSDDDKLLITAAGTGSFWVTLAGKTSAAWKSLKGIAPIFFDEGRQAVVERVRANTELTKIEVDQKRFELGMQKANGILDLFNKIENIKDENIRKKMKSDLSRSVEATGIALPLLASPNSRS